MKRRQYHISILAVLAFISMQAADSCAASMVDILQITDMNALGTSKNDPSIVAAGSVGQGSEEAKLVEERKRKAVAAKDLTEMNILNASRPNDASLRLTKSAMLAAEGQNADANRAMAEGLGIIKTTMKADTISPAVIQRYRTSYLKSVRLVMESYPTGSDGWENLNRRFCGEYTSVKPSAEDVLTMAEIDLLGGPNPPKC